MPPEPLRFLPEPSLELTPEKRAAFDALWEETLATDPEHPLEYALPYPRHEFLRYLTGEKGLLLHGSNQPEIARFEPRRQTDFFGRVTEAVFAASDGIWPIFFAIVDQQAYRGALRNGCFQVPRPDGTTRRVYHFSLNREALARGPWTNGMVYVLPRGPFRRVDEASGDFLQEWLCPHPVAPLARIPVGPEDFPFLEQVQGDDGDDMEEFRVRLITLFGSLTEMRELPDGFAVGIQDTPEQVTNLLALIPLLRAYLPFPGLTVEVAFEPDVGPVWLRLRGPDPVLRALITSVTAMTQEMA